jgi:hypothetical protein
MRRRSRKTAHRLCLAAGIVEALALRGGERKPPRSRAKYCRAAALARLKEARSKRPRDDKFDRNDPRTAFRSPPLDYLADPVAAPTQSLPVVPQAVLHNPGMRWNKCYERYTGRVVSGAPATLNSAANVIGLCPRRRGPAHSDLKTDRLRGRGMSWRNCSSTILSC